VSAGSELRIPARFRKTATTSEEQPLESALWLLDHMCEHLGLEDLGDTELLDFGCGVKFTQALINNSLPIKRYVGVDVDREMIDFLRANVDDPRFEYFHVDARNELYNPGGEVLSEQTKLPIDGRSFDVICLFSVFTHLAPQDYATLLKLLRRYVKPDGRLFYTLFVDELTEGGHGLMDRWTKGMTRAPSEKVAECIEKNPDATGVGTTVTFRDLDPKRPLKWALYSEPYARELVDGSGWEVLELSPPDVYIQHHFVCKPRQ
jgi:SAM-dependent methyltransferase